MIVDAFGFRGGVFLAKLKSGLGPGAREGNAVGLGMNDEDVAVVGSDMGRL